jgi:hypothetical protein
VNTTEILDEQLEKRYREFVSAAARDEEIPPKELRELLLLSGRTAADFRKHIAAVKQRTATAERLKEAGGMRAKVNTLDLQIRAADDELRIRREEAQPYLARVSEAAAKHGELMRSREQLQRQQRDQGNAARRELRKGSDPNLDKEIEELQRQRQQLTKSIEGTRSLDLDKARQNLRMLQEKRAEHARRGEPVEGKLVAEKIGPAEKYVATLEQMQREAAVEQQRVVEVDARIAALEARKLLPESVDWGRPLPTPAEPAADLMLA